MVPTHQCLTLEVRTTAPSQKAEMSCPSSNAQSPSCNAWQRAGHTKDTCWRHEDLSPVSLCLFSPQATQRVSWIYLSPSPLCLVTALLPFSSGGQFCPYSHAMRFGGGSKCLKTRPSGQHTPTKYQPSFLHSYSPSPSSATAVTGCLSFLGLFIVCLPD